MDYVYSANEGLVLNEVQGGRVFMQRGDVWFADDPFVQARPELFSSSPTLVHSTVGRDTPEATPVEVTAPKRARRA